MIKVPFDRKQFFLGTSFFAYALLFLFFYPPVFSIRDESYYLAMAEVLKQGKLSIDQTDVLYWLGVPYGGHVGPRYPLGNSIALLPFVWLGWKSVFLSGLFFHLLSSLLFLKWLRSRGVMNPVAPALYLFFPAFIFYSRTIMSDVPSLFFFMTAYYFYFHPKKQKWTAGFFLGLTLVFRFSNIVYAGAFLGGIFVNHLRGKKMTSFFPILAGFIPGLVLAGLSNAFYYGSPLKTGYINTPDFGFSVFWPHLFHYAASVNLLWPGMLFVFLFSSKTRRIEMWAVVFTAFTLCSFCLYLDDFRNPLATRIFAVRYFFPAFPFLFLSYGEFFETIWNRFRCLRSLVFLTFLFLVLCGGSAAVHFRHQLFLNEQDKLREVIYSSTEDGSVLLFDGNSSELVQRIFGQRFYAPYESMEDIERAFRKWHGLKTIYLVTRQVFYRGILLQNSDPDERQKLEARFEIEQIAEEGGLRIERIAADKYQ